MILHVLYFRGFKNTGLKKILNMIRKLLKLEDLEESKTISSLLKVPLPFFTTLEYYLIVA